ncbi:MAG: hypothetical protein HOH98_05805 [Flavobacteriaceae bacterium]|nr:hypothetical protein [Flavobacteriaceae bacterium]MBT6448993.1 hypothetical protein [Flavobacteriaceae bacterium]
MKSLIKRLITSIIFFLTRVNLIRNKNNVQWKSLNGSNVSISDSFLWRTDNDFSTVFKFTDILNVFYEIDNSLIEIEIYCKNSKLLKKIEFEAKSCQNEFEIDKESIGYEGFGYFNIYHLTKSDRNKKISILNRCYIGFKRKGSVSMVHGNSIVKGKQLANKKIQTNFVNSSIFINKTYKIQNNFSEFDMVELLFVNPINRTIKLKYNGEHISINGHCVKKIKINTINFIEVKSNCNFLRPTVFTYKNRFFDVFHS